MKRKIGVAASLALIAAGALSSGASADCVAVLIKFDADAFAYETSYNPATYISAAGSQLTVVGIVSQFGGALANLDATAAGTEYTFVMSGLTAGAQTNFQTVAGVNRYTTGYGSGTFTIYEDSPRDAPTYAGGIPANPPVAGSVPDRFNDGTPILTGTLSNFNVIVSQFVSTGNWSGSFRADYTFTGPIGGQYYNQVQGTSCLVGGLWSPKGTANGQTNLPAGWSAHPNGKWDGPAVTETASSTWGAIKQLYR